MADVPAAHPVAILGAGGWGTALAVHLARRGHAVVLWARRPEVAQTLATRRENTPYLPGIRLPSGIEVVSGDPAAVAAAHPYLLLAVPSQAVRSMAQSIASSLGPHHRLVLNVAKGLDVDTLQRLSQVIADVAPAASPVLAVLSGPNLGHEVAGGLPAATVASAPAVSPAAQRAQALLMSDSLRVYTTDDVAGVELGGALKNVIALAAGISDGLGYGDNTRGAIITRGLAEMTRLGIRLGARAATFAGLSGLGDLVTTCSSGRSRNTRAGRQLGQGRPLDEVLAASPMVVEGVPTTRAAVALGRRLGVELPIAEEVHRVLFEGADPRDAVRRLMARVARAEEG